MTESNKIIKNKCEGCEKFLLLHNKIMTCESCNKIVHSECAEHLFEYDHLRNFWLCWECYNIDNKRYNPFLPMLNDKYDPVQINKSEDITELSKILSSCQSLNQKSFRNSLSLNSDLKVSPSLMFNNIDGNQSNFDSFVSEISQYSHSFSFIGISETNIDPCHKDLYTIPGYVSEYNVKNYRKHKGSGVALYVKDNYTFTRLEKFCQCTENLESLFVQITNMTEPLYIGVVYRPPGGSKSDALAELQELMQNIPSKRVFILGDFNDDLFKTDSHNFESAIYGNNMMPLISIATHFKPGCNPSLIDNILTNSTENIKMAGVFESGVSHHRPIFCFFDDSISKFDNSECSLPKYDYSETNISNFEKEIESMSHKIYEYSENNFNSFVNDIKAKIEENFKVTSNTTKSSKRNIFSNPWITPGIINCVNKKQHLYAKWRRSVTNKNKHGDSELYDIYKKYRKELKSIIKGGKRSYFSKKFDSVAGNMKKHGPL